MLKVLRICKITTLRDYSRHQNVCKTSDPDAIIQELKLENSPLKPESLQQSAVNGETVTVCTNGHTHSSLSDNC